MFILKSIPKYWVLGKNTDVNDKEQGLPPEHNIILWRKAMSCFYCAERNCKQKEIRENYLRKTPAFLTSILFKFRIFHCGNKWRGACERLFKRRKYG